MNEKGPTMSGPFFYAVVAAIASGFVLLAFDLSAERQLVGSGLLVLGLGACFAVVSRTRLAPDAVFVLVIALSVWWCGMALLGDAPWQAHLAFTGFLVMPLSFLLARAVSDQTIDAVTAAVPGMLCIVALGATVWLAAGAPDWFLLGNQNNLAAWLGALAVVVLGVRAPWHAVGLVALLCAGVAINAIGSRGAMIGLAVGVVLLVIGRGRCALPLRPVGIGVAALVAGALLTEFLKSGETGFGQLATTTTSNARIILWQSAIPLLEQAPFFGIGPGATVLAWPAFRNPLDHTAGFHLHNDYLQFAVEGGIIAGLLLGALAVAAMARVSLGKPMGATALAWGSGAIVVFIHSVFTFNFQLPALLLVVGFGLGVCSRIPATARTHHKNMGAVSVGALTVTLWFGGQTLLVGVLVPTPVAPGDPPAKVMRALERFDLITSIRPDAEPFRTTHADLLRQALANADEGAAWRKRVFDDSRRGFSIAIRSNPYAFEAHLGRALLQLDNSDLTLGAGTAEADLREAIRLRPFAPLPRLLLARQLVGAEEHPAALAILTDGLRWRNLTGDGVIEYLMFTREIAQHEGATTIAEQIDDWLDSASPDEAGLSSPDISSHL